MSGRGILDADMKTIGSLIASGLRWWIDELAALVPPSWRERGGGRGPAVLYDGHDLHLMRGGKRIGPIDGMAADRPLPVTVAPDLCLQRALELPAMSERDFARMLALDGDRIMPMPAGTMLVSGRVVGAQDDAGRIAAAVAGLPVVRAVAMIHALASAGIRPARVMLASDGGAIDFLPAMRAAGLAPPRSNAAAAWWGIVAFLFVLNVGCLIWRDHQSVARLQQIVDEQAPAVSAARMIGGRVAAGQRLAQLSTGMRARHDPLAMLAAVSATLPPDAWVQRLDWDGDVVKLAGYKGRSSNVVTALRAAPGFAEVRNSSTDAVADVPAGQPFDVTARYAALAR